jgi:hypothetical protein
MYVYLLYSNYIWIIWSTVCGKYEYRCPRKFLISLDRL